MSLLKSFINACRRTALRSNPEKGCFKILVYDTPEQKNAFLAGLVDINHDLGPGEVVRAFDLSAEHKPGTEFEFYQDISDLQEEAVKDGQVPNIAVYGLESFVNRGSALSKHQIYQASVDEIKKFDPMGLFSQINLGRDESNWGKIKGVCFVVVSGNFFKALRFMCPDFCDWAGVPDYIELTGEGPESSKA